MGFGGAAGWMFTREGAKVVLTDVDTESGEATASQIRERGGDAMFLHHDVTKEDDWDRVVNRTIASHGKLDVLVNNAGTASQGNRILVGISFGQRVTPLRERAGYKPAATASHVSEPLTAKCDCPGPHRRPGSRI